MTVLDKHGNESSHTVCRGYDCGTAEESEPGTWTQHQTVCLPSTLREMSGNVM